MPLPPKSIHWPPEAIEDLLPDIARLDAWWTGDPDRLRSTYGTPTGAAGKLHPGGRRVRAAQYDGGVVGAVAKMFWGRPPTRGMESRHQLHVPIASDLCQASADILFSEEPQVTITQQQVEQHSSSSDPDRTDTATGGAEVHKAAQERIEHLLDDYVWQVLSEGAEAGAAHGGTYLRINVDTDLSSMPFITRVDYDGAWPEFRFGRLRAVTFWWEVGHNGGSIYRHLERHEMDDKGDGVVLHGLYLGSIDNLGQPVPLADHPSTADLKVDAMGASTVMPRTPGLCVTHIPNQRPNRRWRKHPVGRELGRSDLAGVEGLMDSLDEAYTSWMRDIRLGKGRIFTSTAALDDNGPGRGATFDADREVYQELNALQKAESSGLPIQAVQFEIRVEQHKATCDDLVNRILQTAGYSAATFGEYDGAVMTATEVRSRERRTFLTRDRKVRIYRPALRDLFRKLMDVDHKMNPAQGHRMSGEPLDINVEFPDGVVESMLQIAQTAQTLRGAEAASTETLVRMVNPEWDDVAVQKEVDAILEERSAAAPVLPDPDGFGEGGEGLEGSEDEGDGPPAE